MRFHRIFLNEIKAKGYKVIGFNVFLISLLADPGEGPAPSPLILRPNGGPKGRKKFLGDRAPLIWRSLMRSLSAKRLIWPRLYYFYSLYPLQEKGLNILWVSSHDFGTTKHAREWGLSGVRSTGKANHWMAIYVRYWGTRKIPAFDREQAQREKLASKAKQKFNGRRTL